MTPTRANPQVNPQLIQILKQVSRSFYLSIRVLPKPMRTPVAIAYLLARAADSMTDSDEIAPQNRSLYLQDLLNALLTPELTPASASTQDQANTLRDKLKSLITDPGEQKLIHYLPEIVICFHQLDSKDKNLVQSVINTLVQGMQRDLKDFQLNNQITALKNQQALDEYTYLVAGCVGEFWTKTAIIHLSSVSQWDEQTQSKLGIEFGKALQLTNILRDIAKDARIGRCYLPEDALKANQLTTNQLLDKNNDHLFRPIIFRQLRQALNYFESAERYLLTTPKINIRLRLASIWPILIGLKTLELIADKENFLDANKNIKVERKWVYSMLFRSFLIVGSNRLLKLWIQSIIQNIHSKIRCHS